MIFWSKWNNFLAMSHYLTEGGFTVVHYDQKLEHRFLKNLLSDVKVQRSEPESTVYQKAKHQKQLWFL